MTSVTLQPVRALRFRFDPGDCSFSRGLSAMYCRHEKQQFPKFPGGSEAVMLMLCFGFLLLFRDSGEIERRRKAGCIVTVWGFSSDCDICV